MSYGSRCKQLRMNEAARVCPAYCDVNEDLVLQSADGWIFYIRFYYLRATSVVFRNMLLDAKPSLQPIILDECSEAIKVFLDMATGQDVDRIPWEVPALEMAIKYDAPIVIKAMLATYRCHGDAPAVSWVWYWETFKTAVRYHNQPLARMAIRGLGGTAGSRLSFEQFTSNAARRLDGLAVRDYAELIRCCAQALEDGQEARGVDYWQKAAMTFRLD